jgi:uncharacterized protein (TIGR03083 family)
MEKSAVWPTIQTERRSLAGDLGSLDESGWNTQSLCDAWSVRDVLAHMTATARATPPAFLGKIVASGFSLTKMQDKDVMAARTSSPEEALRRFAAEVSSTKHPPGPIDTWLGETIVHGEDIRRPLGIGHEYPIEALVRVAESYAGSNLIIGGKNRIAGLRLSATDVSWSHGDGPEVSGPMVSLVLAMTGRKSALGDLSGDGVTVLSSRP